MLNPEFEIKNGDVAQLGEHLICIQGVAGSIPVISTIEITDSKISDSKFGI